MDEKDRRSGERFSTLNFIHYTLDNCGEGEIQDMGRTIDASERGLLIQTSNPLPVGQRIIINVGLGENILELSGEIVHCADDEEGMCRSGIEFDTLDALHAEKLSGFLTAFVASQS